MVSGTHGIRDSGWRGWFGGIALLAVSAQVVVFSGTATAQNPAVALGAAKSSVSAAEAQRDEAESQIAPARARYAAINRRAVPANRAATSARRQARDLRGELVAKQEGAASRIVETKADYSREAEDHDDEVSSGIAFGLAALVLAGIALGWGWFRASAPVAWLSDRPQAQAIGLCVFGGVALIVVGAVIDGAGGTFVFLLGFLLPATLLLARHSAEVQRGRAEPLMKRERMPAWVTKAVAATASVLALLAFGSAVFSSDPQEPTISAQLRRDATAEPTSRELTEAKRSASRLSAKAASLNADRRRARHDLEAARRGWHRSTRQLMSAEGEVRRYTRRLAAISRKEELEAEKAEREAIEEEEELAVENDASSSCDPNYTGCLDPNSVDYDCAGGSGNGPDYTGPVEVIGVDHYGLDADGDGYACE